MALVVVGTEEVVVVVVSRARVADVVVETAAGGGWEDVVGDGDGRGSVVAGGGLSLLGVVVGLPGKERLPEGCVNTGPLPGFGPSPAI